MILTSRKKGEWAILSRWREAASSIWGRSVKAAVWVSIAKYDIPSAVFNYLLPESSERECTDLMTLPGKGKERGHKSLLNSICRDSRTRVCKWTTWLQDSLCEDKCGLSEPRSVVSRGQEQYQSAATTYLPFGTLWFATCCQFGGQQETVSCTVCAGPMDALLIVHYTPLIRGRWHKTAPANLAPWVLVSISYWLRGRLCRPTSWWPIKKTLASEL